MNKKLLITSLLILLLAGAGWLGRDWLKKFPLFSSLFGGFQQEAVVPTSGLIAYYPMERNGNTIYDYSKSNNNGTATSVTSAPGKKGTAASFNGTTSTVNAGAGWIGTGDITVSAWIYANTTGEGGFGRIISNGRFELYEENSGGAQRFKVTSDGSASSYATNSSAVFGAWQHIVVTRYANGTNYFYINGVDRTNNTGSGTPATGTTSVTIGNNSGLYTFDGLIDELRVYDRILTSEEITQLYRDGNQTMGGGDKGLIAHYPLASEGQVFQGTDLLSGWDFTSGWWNSNATINSATQFTATTTNGLIQKNSFLNLGSKYSMTIAGTVSAGYFLVTNGSGDPLYSGWLSGSFNSTFDFTATVNTTLRLLATDNGAVVNITSMTLRQEQTSDATPNSRHGTITAGASAGYSTDRHGQANQAYDFDGANTKIDLNSDSIGTSALTFSAWVYADSYGEASGGTLSSILNNGKTKLRIFSSANRVLFYSDGSTGVYAANNSMALGVWRHIVVTRTAAGVTNFYINGVASGTANQSSGTPTAGTTNVIIGNDSVQGDSFDGKISDVKIYNRVLSATEVLKLYDAYNPRLSINGLAKGLIAHYELTQKWSNGTTFLDLTPNNRNGTATSVTVGGRGSDFNGSTSKVDAGADYIGTSAVTVSAWIYADGYGEGGTSGKIIDNGKFSLYLNSSSSGVLEFTSDYLNGPWPTTYTGTLLLNRWYHVLVTRSAAATNNASLYINGVLNGSADRSSGTPVAGTNVIIGNNTGQTQTFDGRIADVRVYNRVLSTTEITQLYGLGRPRAVDRATDLNGTTQYFTLADGASAGDDMEPGTSDFMLEAWVDADAFAANQIIAAKSSDITGSTSLYGMYLNSSARLVGKIADADSVTTSTDDGTALTANKWYHLAVIFDRDGNMTRYVDGVVYGSANSIAGEAGSLTNAVGFSVDAESDGGLPLNGQVDGVRVYKFTSGLPTNLSEIMSYHASVKGRIHPDIAASLVDGWDFDGEGWARGASTHNLTNNGTATFVKP